MLQQIANIPQFSFFSKNFNYFFLSHIIQLAESKQFLPSVIAYMNEDKSNIN